MKWTPLWTMFIVVYVCEDIFPRLKFHLVKRPLLGTTPLVLESLVQILGRDVKSCQTQDAGNVHTALPKEFDTTRDYHVYSFLSIDCKQSSCGQLSASQSLDQFGQSVEVWSNSLFFSNPYLWV